MSGSVKVEVSGAVAKFAARARAKAPTLHSRRLAMEDAAPARLHVQLLKERSAGPVKYTILGGAPSL